MIQRWKSMHPVRILTLCACYIQLTSHERHGVLNQRQLDCLFNIKENPRAPHHRPFVNGIHQWPTNQFPSQKASSAESVVSEITVHRCTVTVLDSQSKPQWHLRVVMIPTLSSLVAPAVVVMTTAGTTSDDEVDRIASPIFQYLLQSPRSSPIWIREFCFFLFQKEPFWTWIACQYSKQIL